MKLFYKGKDGGNESTVWGYWLVEIKSLFSIVLLCFENGSREAFHNHAFNCFSWVLRGELVEEHLDGEILGSARVNTYKPSIFPFCTYRDTFHKVSSKGRTWVLSFRGPWSKTWKENIDGKEITLTHGRQVVG